MTGVHEWTSDLVFVAGLALLATATVLRDLTVAAIRVPVVVPLLLFLPGYAVLSVLYPDRPTEGSQPGEDERRSVDAVERVVLSIALSLAIVPGVALVANFTTGIEPRPVALGLAAVTIGGVLLALVARLRTPSAVRFRLDARSLLATVQERSFTTTGRTLRDRGLFDAETGLQRALNVVFVVALLTVAASAGFATVGTQSPASDASFTEYYLLGETDNGTLTTGAVPRTFDSGESRSVYVGIQNHEGERVEYTTVVLLQRVGDDGDVGETSELGRFSETVPAGGTERVERSVAPEMTGDRLRLVFLLYRGEPPSQPTQENAYRAIRVWITVGGSGTAQESVPLDGPGPGADD